MTRDEIDNLLNGLARDAGRRAVLLYLSADKIAAAYGECSNEFVADLRAAALQAIGSVDALAVLGDAARMGALSVGGTLPLSWQEVDLPFTPEDRGWLAE